MSKITIVAEKPKPPERKIVIELSVMEAAHLGAFLLAAEVGWTSQHLFKTVYSPLYTLMEQIARENRVFNDDAWHGVTYKRMEQIALDKLDNINRLKY